MAGVLSSDRDESEQVEGLHSLVGVPDAGGFGVELGADGAVPVNDRVAPLLWIVCAGGYRSGSTLQYDLIGHYLELTGQGSRMGYGAHHEVYAPHTGIGVVKSHALGGWDWRIIQGTAVAVSVHRTTADREASMCRFFGIDRAELHESFVWREDRLNVALWKVVGTYEQDYKLLTKFPQSALKALVHHLGLVWDQGMANYAAKLADRTDNDPLSLLHENHRQTS